MQYTWKITLTALAALLAVQGTTYAQNYGGGVQFGNSGVPVNGWGMAQYGSQGKYGQGYGYEFRPGSTTSQYAQPYGNTYNQGFGNTGQYNQPFSNQYGQGQQYGNQYRQYGQGYEPQYQYSNRWTRNGYNGNNSNNPQYHYGRGYWDGYNTGYSHAGANQPYSQMNNWQTGGQSTNGWR